MKLANKERLVAYLSSYLEWAEEGAVTDKFNRGCGLCTNTMAYEPNNWYELERELIEAFEDYGLSTLLPFEMEGHRYSADARYGTHHTNPKRIAWINQYLKENT